MASARELAGWGPRLRSHGSRPGEARRLTLGDVDLADGAVCVRESKGGKDRNVFMSPDLAAYLADYEPQVTALQPGREAFFPNRQGRPNSSSTIGHWSAQLLNAADDEQTTARPGPRGRPYDLRHAHVVENINRETLAGRGPQALVPHLAAHLGHKNLEDTWHYFHLAPDFHHDLRELANSGVEDTIAEAGHGIL